MTARTGLLLIDTDMLILLAATGLLVAHSCQSWLHHHTSTAAIRRAAPGAQKQAIPRYIR